MSAQLRPGFTLVEVLVALTITAVIGAAVTSVFATQTRFYDRQEKVSSARGVSRAATNILTSELRMLERVQGVQAATADRLELFVPYVMGVACGASGGSLVVRYLPTDTVVLRRDTVFSGHAWMNSSGSYTYINNNTIVPQLNTGASVCSAAGIRDIPGGGTLAIAMGTPGAVPVATPVFLYQRVTYEFKNSAAFPGRRALWRRTDRNGRDDELVAPFASTARFRFYVNDSATPIDSPPAAANLDQLTGIQIIMDGLSERPDADGTHQSVPLSTSVFFKNRL
jgi:prepilin-type N-terminal cleavage/methylation domain-containing protein